MFGWLTQAEPIVVDSESQLLFLLGLLILGAGVLLVLILFMVVRRMRKTQSGQKGVQSRLDDIAQPSSAASPPAATAVRASAPAGRSIAPEPLAQTLTPIEQKLLEVEQAEAASRATEQAQDGPVEGPLTELPAASAGAMVAEDLAPESDWESTELASADLFGDLELEDDTEVDALWNDLNFEFEKEGELAFLMGEDLPDEPEPEPPLTVLADIEARTFLEQVNQYRLNNRGQIAESEREISLSWQSAIGSHELLVTAQDAETLSVNGEQYPATPDGVKQGIVAALKNANY